MLTSSMRTAASNASAGLTTTMSSGAAFGAITAQPHAGTAHKMLAPVPLGSLPVATGALDSSQPHMHAVFFVRHFAKCPSVCRPGHLCQHAIEVFIVVCGVGFWVPLMMHPLHRMHKQMMFGKQPHSCLPAQCHMPQQ